MLNTFIGLPVGWDGWRLQWPSLLAVEVLEVAFEAATNVHTYFLVLKCAPPESVQQITPAGAQHVSTQEVHTFGTHIITNNARDQP